MDRQGNARAHRVQQNASELAQAMADGIVSLNDATRIQFEPEDVRRQAVDDVREGRAATAARAIRQRYGRDPVPDPDAPPDRSADQPAPLHAAPPGEVTVSPRVLGFIRQLLGEISYDPCSAAWCAEHVGAQDWCGVDADGLVTKWAGAVWVFRRPSWPIRSS